MPHRTALFTSLVFVVLCSGGLSADVFYEIPLEKLKFTDGTRPKIIDFWRGEWRRAHIDQGGEAYVRFGPDPGAMPVPGSPPPYRININERKPLSGVLVVRAPEGKNLSGWIGFPQRTGRYSRVEQYQRVAFSVPSEAMFAAKKNEFYRGRENYYASLARQDIAGAAWFAYQARESRRQRGADVDAPQIQPNRPRFQSDLEESFALFTGGRAIRENLQLDRQLLVRVDDDEPVPLSTIKGISVKELNWKELIKGKDPKLDRLARQVPFDQHAIFFPSFKHMLQVFDEADAFGTPVVYAMEARTQNANTGEKYKKQLCLETTGLSRTFGPSLIASVAMTGSDAYLRSGSDVAVLFEAKNAPLLAAFIRDKHGRAMKSHTGATRVEGNIDRVAYTGVISPGRQVCSYTATLGNTVVVTNSLYQLKRLVQTHEKAVQALADSDEYKFFRDRYQLAEDGESAFLFLSDATIRRWCSPRWRILASRRMRAAMLMADIQCEFHDELIRGNTKTREFIRAGERYGRLRITPSGVESTVYGNLAFQTPIAEIDIKEVTRTEADAYNRWRNGYQRNWSGFFDPIGVRIALDDENVTLDVTVMPLILGTEYREFADIARGADLRAKSSDFHKESILHFGLAVNPKSPALQMPPSLNWLGNSIELFVDQDEILKQLADAVAQGHDAEQFLVEQRRFPVGLRIALADRKTFETFFADWKPLIRQISHNQLEDRKHNGQVYVKVDIDGTIPQLFYTITDTSFYITLDEGVIKRAIDRERDRAAGKPTQVDDQWQGEHLAANVKESGVNMLETITSSEYRSVMRQRSWSNIPILNEWKHRYPDEDPTQLYEQFWHAKLVCPGGGKYVWNAEAATMESTAFGHPSGPKAGERLPHVLSQIQAADFGITFENDGLRARAVIHRRQPAE